MHMDEQRSYMEERKNWTHWYNKALQTCLTLIILQKKA